MVILNGLDGTPGEIRTPDPLLRRQVLYPAELRAHANVHHWRRTTQAGSGLPSRWPHRASARPALTRLPSRLNCSHCARLAWRCQSALERFNPQITQIHTDSKESKVKSRKSRQLPLSTLSTLFSSSSLTAPSFRNRCNLRNLWIRLTSWRRPGARCRSHPAL